VWNGEDDAVDTHREIRLPPKSAEKRQNFKLILAA
jgi:hypothetical protein